MKPGAGYFSFFRLILLCLSILLGIHGTAWTATMSKKTQRRPSRITYQPKKSSRTSRPRKKIKTTTPQKKISPPLPTTEAPQPAPTRRPKLLKIIQPDPWTRLDALVIPQHIAQAPYVPLVQTIGVAADYGRLAMNLWTQQERRYAGSLHIVFRKNIQLSATWGSQKLVKKCELGNKSGYTAAGHYGRIGLDYFVFYKPRYNLYAGLCHGRSYFKNCTTPENEHNISNDLAASWWELNIGSEQQLFRDFGLYAGLIFHLRGWGSFAPFEPAINYVVPGYGRCVQKVVPALTLYIKYTVSFLKKKITLP